MPYALKSILSAGLLLLCIQVLNGQSVDSLDTNKDSLKYVKGPAKPEIGFGVGMLSMFGDIKDFDYGNPLVSRVAYSVTIKQMLNDWLGFKFHAMHGKVGINENSFSRNLNFESKITTGGLSLVYEFNNLLKPDRKVSPYISAGLEAIEFHSKTDLYDKYGNQYHYWSDGSIRNLDESDPNANQAVRVYRDYVYETDMREMNYDKYGKYPERTWGIPVTMGFTLHMNERMNFHYTSTMHFTFSDLVDNVTDQSTGARIGDRPGNKRNDWFMYNAVMLTYDFTREVPEKPGMESGQDNLLAYDQDDFDGDGIIDWFDKCPQTPEGVEVDENGCPVDEDNDGVGTYMDDELETPDSLEVTPNGIGLTDSMIYNMYMAYMDTTGLFGAERVVRTYSLEQERKKLPKKKYVVKIGEYEEGIDDDLVDALLSIPDVETHVDGSKTIFTVGDYNNLPDAIKRKIDLTKKGIEGTEVMIKEGDGSLTEVGDQANNMTVENGSTENGSQENGSHENGSHENGQPTASNDQVLFRVQIGAYSRRRSKSSFGSNVQVLEIKNDGLYKYMTGSYDSFEKAKARQDELRSNNYSDAFVVAYKGGERVSLRSAGVSSAPKDRLDIKNDNEPKEDEVDPNKIVLQIQIGAYKNQLPTEVLSKFIELEDVNQTEIKGGITRYTAGSFTSYEEAESYLETVKSKGLTNAFIIAIYNGLLMPLEEALKHLGE